MNGQMSIFDFIPTPEVTPGQWITREDGLIGDEMTFDEIANSVGKLIVMDMSTVSHEWYKVVLVERIATYEDRRRLIYYDGCKQRGLVDEMYFDETCPFTRSRAYRLAI